MIGARTARLHAGSLALCIARLWGREGLQVVLVDADTTGAALASRFGEATRATFVPSERGVPSLMSARKPLSLRLIAEHCYNLSDSQDGGSLWAAFAPANIGGGAVAAHWLAEHVGDLLNIDAERRVMLSGSLLLPTPDVHALLQAASILVFVAPAGTREQLQVVADHIAEADLGQDSEQFRLLIAEGDRAMSSAQIREAAGFHLIGRLPVIEDEKILRTHGSRRERTFVNELEAIADRLLRVLTASVDGVVSGDESSGGVDGVVSGDESSGGVDGVVSGDESSGGVDGVVSVDEPFAPMVNGGLHDPERTSALSLPECARSVIVLPEAVETGQVCGVLVLPSAEQTGSPKGVVALPCAVVRGSDGGIEVIPSVPVPEELLGSLSQAPEPTPRALKKKRSRR